MLCVNLSNAMCYWSCAICDLLSLTSDMSNGFEYVCRHRDAALARCPTLCRLLCVISYVVYCKCHTLICYCGICYLLWGGYDE